MSRALALAAVVVVLALAASGTSTAGGTQKIVDHDFVGADRCRTCHAAAYAQWEKTPHARAFEVLSGKDRADPRCLACHTLVPEDLGAGLTGVQCESCHGAGRNYAVDFVMRDDDLRTILNLQKVDAATCTRCHTDSSPGLVPFALKDKLPLVKHWAASSLENGQPKP